MIADYYFVRKITKIEQIDRLEIAASWVLKPVARKGGQGVLVKIEEKNELKKYAAELLKIYPSLIVEEYIRGDDFRFLILDGRLLGAVKRISPTIVGDGRHNVGQLIEFANQNERGRGANTAKAATRPECYWTGCSRNNFNKFPFACLNNHSIF